MDRPTHACGPRKDKGIKIMNNYELEQRIKLLERFIDMILEAQGLAIDRPNNFFDMFLGTDINNSTLRIRRVSNPRI